MRIRIWRFITGVLLLLIGAVLFFFLLDQNDNEESVIQNNGEATADKSIVYSPKPNAVEQISPVYGREIKGLPEFCADKLISVSSCNGLTKITTDQGNTYRLVEIGDQCWFADNAKEIPTTDKGWYGYYKNVETETSVGEGLLYTWDAAMNGETRERTQGVCPTSWHVPSDCEFGFIDDIVGIKDYKKITRSVSQSSIEKPYLKFLLKNHPGWKTPYEYFNGKGKSTSIWTSSQSANIKNFEKPLAIARFFYAAPNRINVTRS